MENNTFTAGVEPGGLTDHTEIKILICHLLCQLGPIAHDDILEAITGYGYANYFECASSLSDLLAAGHIRQSEASYTVLDSGREIVSLLAADIPLTVRERALRDAGRLMRRRRNRETHITTLTETPSGYRLRCTVRETSGAEPFALELDLPTRSAAQRARDCFIDNAEEIMRECLAHLLDEDI